MDTAPIIIIDDDSDDREFLEQAWSELKYQNPLIFFNRAEPLIEYFESNKATPFLILCDVNIPGMDGFKLKETLLEDTSINYKSIPFVFWSSSVTKMQIQKAYDLGVNGFFVKETNFEDIKQSLIDIVEYWLKSKVPE